MHFVSEDWQVRIWMCSGCYHNRERSLSAGSSWSLLYSVFSISNHQMSDRWQMANGKQASLVDRAQGVSRPISWELLHKIAQFELLARSGRVTPQVGYLAPFYQVSLLSTLMETEHAIESLDLIKRTTSLHTTRHHNHYINYRWIQLQFQLCMLLLMPSQSLAV